MFIKLRTERKLSDGHTEAVGLSFPCAHPFGAHDRKAGPSRQIHS